MFSLTSYIDMFSMSKSTSACTSRTLFISDSEIKKEGGKGQNINIFFVGVLL